MTAVDAAATEIEAALAVARPQLQGLVFFLRLDQAEETKQRLEQARVDTTRRMQVLEVARSALRALVDDQYPDVPVREVPPAVLEDLSGDLTVEQAALALFTTETAAALHLTAGQPEPK